MAANAKDQLEGPTSFQGLFMATLLFLLLSALTTTDADLFLGEGTISFPIIEYGISISLFKFVGPVTILFLHLFLLVQTHSQYTEFRLKKDPDSPTEPFPLDVHLAPGDTFPRLIVRGLIFMIVVVLPLFVQLQFFALLLKYQDLAVSLVQGLVVVAEVLCIYRFRYAVGHWPPGQMSFAYRSFLRGTLGLTALAVLMGWVQLFAVFQGTHIQVPFRVHFQLEYFVKEGQETNDEYKTIRDRSFRFMEFSEGRLAHMDFFDCDFYGAHFSNTQLSDLMFKKGNGITRFSGCTLSETLFLEQTFTSAQFNRTNLSEMSFHKSHFQGTSTFLRCTIDQESYQVLTDATSRRKLETMETIIFNRVFVDTLERIDNLVYENFTPTHSDH